MTSDRLEFLSRVEPFDRLSDKELRAIAALLEPDSHPEESTLFVQGQTRVDNVYILAQGRLEQYVLENQEKLLRSFLGPGDIYGPLSILFNQGVSISTVTSLEQVQFYKLDKTRFLELCSKELEFTRHFTKAFSEKMLQKSYVSNIIKSIGAGSNAVDGLSGSFFYQDLENILFKEVLTCGAEDSVQTAARRMTSKGKSSIVIQDQQGRPQGLLTDHDIREKVIVPGNSIHDPVREYMSSPLITTPANTQAFEALLLMMEHNIKHLAVTGQDDELLGIATDQDFLLAQGQSPVFFMHELHKANNLQTLKLRFQQLPGTIKYLLQGGAKAIHLNSVITAISDLILQKVVSFALLELPEPPVDFAFLVMGSEGRKEQTLKTDQDNALVFADHGGKPQEIQDYFLGLGKKVCYYLNEIGYEYCEYEIMAQNPKWCQPLSVWKEYFQDWIRTAEPEALLQSSIFFDFRTGYGSKELVRELRGYLFSSLTGWKGFFRHLAENALCYKPPLDFFGQISLLSKGEYKNKLDIKTPMRLIVDFARIYALKNELAQTNTLERLRAIYQADDLERQDYEELVHAYSYMMNMRLQHQAGNIVDRQTPADNYLDLKEFTHIEQQALRESFKRIRMVQGKMRLELTSATGIT